MRLPEAVLWQHVAEAMQKALADPALRNAAQGWPDTVAGASVGNLLLYEDPDYGFVFNATVRAPNCTGNVHDHGTTWTLYGLVEGHETMCRYERLDGASSSPAPGLRLVSRQSLGPGDIDVVPPGEIHQEVAGEGRSIAFIVRARRPGSFAQHQYDPVSGAASTTRGPQQFVQPI
jgi:predicted metal-dependent enzyme (double-stranded beta helix superfamily)